MKGSKMKVCLELTEEMLGTASVDPEIHRKYIAARGPNAKSREEEIASLGEYEFANKSMTIFPREDRDKEGRPGGRPIMWDYQIKGFFKDACGMLSRVKGEGKGTRSSKIKAYRKVIDGLIFVEPRKIPIVLPEGYDMDIEDGYLKLPTCQRPLRAQTAQGERVALAESEVVPERSIMNFNVVLLDPAYENVVREWLDYGALRGLGQWRNSGKGRFKWREIEAGALRMETEIKENVGDRREVEQVLIKFFPCDPLSVYEKMSEYEIMRSTTLDGIDLNKVDVYKLPDRNVLLHVKERIKLGYYGKFGVDTEPGCYIVKGYHAR